MSKEPKSAIWHSNYFKRNIGGDTLCILCEQNRCKMCKSAKNSCVLTGSHASNAKKHLKTLHPKEHEKFMAIETTNQIASTSTPERQQKRKFAEGPPFGDFFKARPCPSNVVTEQKQNLARLVARPTTPISIVESDEFIKFVENYDSRFKIPRSSHGIERLLKDKATAVFIQMKELIANALSKISIGLDVWTDQGLKYSYLAMTGHFISNDFQYKKVFLGIKAIKSHTAESIRNASDHMRSEIGISESCICAYITDNGSNIIKAFKNDFEEMRTLLYEDEVCSKEGVLDASVSESDEDDDETEPELEFEQTKQSNQFDQSDRQQRSMRETLSDVDTPHLTNTSNMHRHK